NYPIAEVADKCPGVMVGCSPAPGSPFPIGTTTVVCRATDSGGATSSCSMLVTVNRPAPAGPSIQAVAIDGKMLLVFGEGFVQGAVLLVDGGKQKSANDALNPATTLIAKKAAKFLVPGQTYTLQVQNPGGVLSPGFSFTRLAN